MSQKNNAVSVERDQMEQDLVTKDLLCQALADKFLELRAERNALAAENAVMLKLLTDISENHVEYFSEGEGYTFAGVPLDYVSEINMYISRDVNAENPFPATDAILNAVRAEGVEMFANHCLKRRGEMMKTEPNEAVVNQAITATRRAGEFALHFAAQLRAGNAGKDGV